MSCIYRKLISLNLMLLILCSIIYIPAYAESDSDGLNIKAQTGNTGVLIVDGIQYDADQDIKGDGWRYSVNKYVENGPDVIYLNDYTGSGIIFKKNIKSLQIFASGNNKIIGTDTPCIQYENGNLYIDLESESKLQMFAGEENHAISAEQLFLVSYGSNSSDNASKTCLSISGSEGVAAVKADNVSITSRFKGEIKINGGVNGSAIEISKNIKLESGHLELKGNKKPAIVCTNDTDDYVITYDKLYKYYVGSDENNTVRMTSHLPEYGNNGGGSSGSGGIFREYIGNYVGQVYLKTEPETYYLTLDANGGTVKNKRSITVEVELADGINIDSYKPEKKGFLFNGWYADKDGPYYVYKKVDLNNIVYRQKQVKDVTVYAGWFKAEKGDVIVTGSYSSNSYNKIAATSTGDVYRKISNSNIAILPSYLYDYTNASGSNLLYYKRNIDIWVDQKYDWTNKGYTVLEDKNGEKYASYVNGIYESGSRVKKDNSRVKIMKPFSTCLYNTLYYYLGDGEVTEGGNVIAEETYTSGDLQLYVRDDTGMTSPENKKLIGWSLNKEAYTVNYSPGDIITLENGAVKKLYAVWDDNNCNTRFVKFNDIVSNDGMHYVAYYDANGQLLKLLKINVDENGEATIILNNHDFEKTYRVKLFVLDSKTSAPMDSVKTATKNSKGEFEITT